ncbi:hypothetical protein AB6A40_005031 [Gnathostoma spinigerum]|uniref:TIL domain-containing protein n=1 Tax=Gnathostoma spinigerum TaxID=75299 RepID=A0ABD6EP48_9BILA
MNRLSIVVLAACFLVCSCKWSYYQEPDECTENERWGECVTPCEETCYLSSERPCSRNCYSKCFCKEGYVRRIQYGECILKKDCPPRQPDEGCPTKP